MRLNIEIILLSAVTIFFLGYLLWAAEVDITAPIPLLAISTTILVLALIFGYRAIKEKNSLIDDPSEQIFEKIVDRYKKDPMAGKVKRLPRRRRRISKHQIAEHERHSLIVAKCSQEQTAYYITKRKLTLKIRQIEEALGESKGPNSDMTAKLKHLNKELNDHRLNYTSLNEALDTARSNLHEFERPIFDKFVSRV